MVEAGTVGKQPSTGLDRGKGILSEEFFQRFFQFFASVPFGRQSLKHFAIWQIAVKIAMKLKYKINILIFKIDKNIGPAFRLHSRA